MTNGVGGRMRSSAAGVLLGFAGAALDFYSGYQLYAGSGMPSEQMGVASSMGTGEVWGTGIVLLGLVLAGTSTLVGLGKGISMRDAGSLMAVFGGAMVFVGAAMLLGLTSMAQAAVFSGIGMLAVGFLMLANGAVMRRSRME